MSSCERHRRLPPPALRRPFVTPCPSVSHLHEQDPSTWKRSPPPEILRTAKTRISGRSNRHVEPDEEWQNSPSEPFAPRYRPIRLRNPTSFPPHLQLSFDSNRIEPSIVSGAQRGREGTSIFSVPAPTTTSFCILTNLEKAGQPLLCVCRSFLPHFSSLLTRRIESWHKSPPEAPPAKKKFWVRAEAWPGRTWCEFHGHSGCS